MNAITLEEAKSTKLMTRVDSKYVITYAQYYDFINYVQDDFNVVQENNTTLFKYYTVYFDTNGLDILKAHRSKSPHRQKIRIREYSTGEKFLEIKDKKDHVTKKIRIPVKSYEINGERQWISENFMYDTKGLNKTLSTEFSRMTLVSNDKSTRITIDFNLEVVNFTNGNKWKSDQVIVEVKKPTEQPTKADLVLEMIGAMQQGFSKYNVGMAMTSI